MTRSQLILGILGVLHAPLNAAGHGIWFSDGACHSITASERGEPVGRVCGEFSSDFKNMEMTIVLHQRYRSPEMNCTLDNVHFGNLPYTSPEHVKSDSFAFHIAVPELERYLCSFDEDFTIIDGEVTSVCMNMKHIYQHTFHTYFSLPMQCIRDKPSEEKVISPESIENKTLNKVSPATQVEEVAVQTIVLGGPQKETAESEVDKLFSQEEKVTSEEGTTTTQQEETKGPSSQEIATDIIDNMSTRNSFVRTPKTGGRAMGYLLRKLFREVLGFEGAEKQRLCPVWTKHNDETGELWDNETSKTGCVLVHGERRWHPSLPERSYVMMRDPVEHLVSLYFYCTESSGRGHRNEQLLKKNIEMPSLEEWLDIWISLKKREEPPRQIPASRFECHSPINLQSYFMGDPVDETDLSKRFDVVGLTSEMRASSCVIFIKLTGIVPESCNCLGKDTDASEGQRKLLETPSREYTSPYGQTVNVTQEQLEKLESLTDVDRRFYKAAESMFAEKVAEVEKQYGIKVCGNVEA